MKPIQLEEQFRVLPACPGVYLFKDKQGKIIYVGKTANLSNRIKSYFSTFSNLPPKIQQLVSKVDDLEFVIADSEQEALILECNLIKKHRPRYNVRLKDSKTFPYLKITLNEDWPGVYVTRRLLEDGARYFGPFASAGSVRQTLKLLRRVFPFRSCTRSINGTDKRPCLDYYIHRCLAPCIGAVSKQEYAEVIKQVILFLEGKQELVLSELNKQMKEAAKQLQFEKAALLRNQIRAMERIIEGQKIAITLRGEQDVIALAQDEGQAYVEIFFIRNNKLIGHDHFMLEGTHDESPSQLMTSFVKQYYASTSYIPSLILLQYPVEEIRMLSEWLKRQRGSNVKVQLPQRGLKKQLLNMVAENANRGLLLAKAKQTNSQTISSALQELKNSLNLPRIPSRIECYDISNIHGTLAVGSMVVMEKGLPQPAHYRRFRIKTVAWVNDYAMIREVLRRRLKRVAIVRSESGETVSQRGSWATMPDLILIDGGKGHLNTALEVRQESGLDSIPMASLAKENEDIFIPGKAEPVDMAKDSPALHLLQRARDEAHRFAISYHQRLRRKQSRASILDDIPGIGPKRKKALIKNFGSIKVIKEASEEELCHVKGITPALAQKLKQYL